MTFGNKRCERGGILLLEFVIDAVTFQEPIEEANDNFWKQRFPSYDLTLLLDLCKLKQIPYLQTLLRHIICDPHLCTPSKLCILCESRQYNHLKYISKKTFYDFFPASKRDLS